MRGKRGNFPEIPTTEQRHLSAQKRSVARRLDDLFGKWKKPDAPGTRTIDVVAECACKVELFDAGRRRSQTFQQNLDARGDSSLGQLQFPNIGLNEGDRPTQRYALRTGGEPSGGLDRAPIQQMRHGVHKPAAAKPARLATTQDFADQSI